MDTRRSQPPYATATATAPPTHPLPPPTAALPPYPPPSSSAHTSATQARLGSYSAGTSGDPRHQQPPPQQQQQHHHHHQQHQQQQQQQPYYPQQQQQQQEHQQPPPSQHHHQQPYQPQPPQPSQAQAAHPPPPPPPPSQQQPQQQQQQYSVPPPPYANHSSPHQSGSTAPNSTTSTPQHHHHHQHHHHQQHHYPQQQQHHQQPPPAPPTSAHSSAPPPSTPSNPSPYAGASLPPAQGTALPPIQSAPYAPTASAAEQHSLPSFRHPSAPGPPPPPAHDPREGSEYPPPPQHYQHHTHSGHATPASVGHRSYSHDSAHHQRTPTTPVGPPPSQQYPPQPPPPPQQHHQHHRHHQQQQPPPQPPPPGPAPAPPPSSAPHSMDHSVQHHGYPTTNGLQHSLPAPPPPPPAHHEPHPQYMQQPMMDSQSAYQQQPQAMYGPTAYGSANGVPFGTKRKQMRATQACEQCRQRKQKCDEGSPCSFCKENNLSCQYRDTPPAKTDKNTEKILQFMEAQSMSFQELAAKVDSIGARLDRIEQTLENGVGTGFAALEEPAATRKPELDDHRTAPHKLLLLWPSVRPLLEAANVTYSDSYVMEAEDRGVLRLWTRGEGIDENDGTHPGGAPSPAHSDESGDITHIATPRADGLWGVGFPQTPNSEIRRSEPYGAGGLKANGDIDLDPTTINSLYESYMKHIHIMHPFLDKRRLKKMIDGFIKQYSTGKSRAAFVSMESERPTKRQRTNGSSTAASVAAGFEETARKNQTERSPGNAIIYLVLALGKICQYNEPLPAIVPDSMRQANTLIAHQIAGAPGLHSSSPVTVSIKPSPMSPKSTPTTNPTPPSELHQQYESRSRRPSIDGGSPPFQGPKNLDVVPGIAYYAKAAEILGDQGDGNDLVHAQMFLLAGLYKGQLARVKESMSWFTIAGRAIMILLDRYKLYNERYWSAYGDVRKQHEQGQSRIKDTRHALIVLASWTCLQLESDILAELRLPSSNIQNIENMLLMPNRSPVNELYQGLEPDGRQEDYDNILLYYTSQLFLRRRLNQAHRQMYGPECLTQPLSEVKEIVKGHEEILNGWRSQLPDILSWQDEDEPPSDILAARLRAKYYGARYVINRPFLDYALHIMPYVREGKTVEASARDGHGNPRDKADIHLFKAIQQLGDGDIWARAEQCINAAMASTIAFDNVPDRLIVTNIHGTAHAQFGNILVLSAAYNNHYLKQLVPTDRFQFLMRRTITFLRRLAPISPTCAADCGILEKFNNYLFGAPADIKHVYLNEGIEPVYRSEAAMTHRDHSGSSSATNSFHANM